MIAFINPRAFAEIPNYPIGGSRRATAIFGTDRHATRGIRIYRTTTGKPKFTTYCHRACIMDGDNGRTYILMMSDPAYGCPITIKSADMKHDARDDEIGGPHYVPHDNPEYAALSALLDAVK